MESKNRPHLGPAHVGNLNIEAPHNASEVSVIDAATNAVVATVPFGPEPEGVAVSPDGSKVYVAIGTGTSGTASVIDTATNT
jgi:YVTN family beta-propeller protein